MATARTKRSWKGRIDKFNEQQEKKKKAKQA